MKNDKIVIINGQKYNSATGLPLGKSLSQPKKTNTIRSVHSLAQRSKNLYNRASQKTISDLKLPISKIGRSMDIARSKSISHFAPRLAVTPKKSVTKNKLMDIGPVKHPLAAKVEQKRSMAKNILASQSSVNKSTKTIKEEVIAEALSKVTPNRKKKKNFLRRNAKFINIFTVSVVILIAVAYFTYLSLPGIQVSIASAQAGVNATYPEYHPDGYSMAGPVSYTDGKVIINFHANTGNAKYTLEQSTSLWDSSALKLQVDKESNNTTDEKLEGGLTIYTYAECSNASWVNNRILYTIIGDAKLSCDQIRHIATSL